MVVTHYHCHQQRRRCFQSHQVTICFYVPCCHSLLITQNTNSTFPICDALHRLSHKKLWTKLSTRPFINPRIGQRNTYNHKQCFFAAHCEAYLRKQCSCSVFSDWFFCCSPTLRSLHPASISNFRCQPHRWDITHHPVGQLPFRILIIPHKQSFVNTQNQFFCKFALRCLQLLTVIVYVASAKILYLSFSLPTHRRGEAKIWEPSTGFLFL